MDSLDIEFSQAPRSSVKLSLVVPVFNEADSIHFFLKEIQNLFDLNNKLQLEIVFINDGSEDNTLDQLLRFQNKYASIRVLDLSRNFGKEAALAAGLKFATGQVIVPIDVDLQDPPEVIPQMIDLWRSGFDVVLGMRADRNSDSLAKRISAKLFYKIHNRLSEPKIPENVGDFRLMDRMVVDALNEFPESKRYMKGLFAWVGFRTTTLRYTRAERVAGNSKFNGWRLWNFALDGLTSFSTAPLKIWSYLGAIIALISFLYATIIVLKVVFFGIDAPGFASVIVAVTFLGGLQLIGIGILGEYLGRSFIESKRRPVFLVRSIYEPKS